MAAPFDYTADGSSQSHPCNPERNPPYQGVPTYYLYHQYQRELATWLINTTADLGEAPPTCTEWAGEMIVPFHDVLRLANAVSKRGRVPTCILMRLDFMLELREKFDPPNETPLPGATDDEDEPRYQYFIAMNTLRSVRSLLVSARVSEECKMEKAVSEHRYALPDLPDEVLFAWVCFFDDLFVIREYVKATWLEYCHSIATLGTATLVTNTALWSLQWLFFDFSSLLEHLPNGPTAYNVPEWVYQRITSRSSPPCHFNENLRNLKNSEAHWCCYEAHLALKKTMPLLKKVEVGALGIIPPRVVHNQTKISQSWFFFDRTNSSQISKFVISMCMLLHNFKALYNHTDEKTDACFLSSLDEVTNSWVSWEHYEDPERIPFSVSLSFQIWLDITETLFGYSPNVTADIRREKDFRQALYCDYSFRRCPSLATETRSELAHAVRILNGNAILKRNVQSILKYLNMDNFARKTCIEMEKAGHACSVDIDFLFHEKNPLMSGMYVLTLEEFYRRFEASAVKLHESIMPAALLYSSMRELGVVDLWPDMEFAIKTWGNAIFACELDDWETGSVDNALIFKSYQDFFPNIYRPDVRKVPHPFPSYRPFPAEEPVEASAADFNEGMVAMINRIFPHENARNVLREKGNNLLWQMDLMKAARYQDEILANFDWFMMHDVCTKFFDSLRERYRDNFKSYERDCSATDGSDAPTSLNALFFLLFWEGSKEGIENMVLSAFCFNPSKISCYDIKNLNYMTERWSDDMTMYAAKLDISIESAGAVFNGLIASEGEAVMKEAAKRHRDNQLKMRVDTTGQEDLVPWYEREARSQWWHPSQFPTDSHPTPEAGSPNTLGKEPESDGNMQPLPSDDDDGKSGPRKWEEVATPRGSTSSENRPSESRSSLSRWSSSRSSKSKSSSSRSSPSIPSGSCSPDTTSEPNAAGTPDKPNASNRTNENHDESSRVGSP
ncbi:hypothetical protein F4802DRAFT_227214 [Xylaria palmicola]|nr:hypothetical protein F4802DRAFT_227214 [Xylaria palmicola]